MFAIKTKSKSEGTSPVLEILQQEGMTRALYKLLVRERKSRYENNLKKAIVGFSERKCYMTSFLIQLQHACKVTFTI